MISDNLFRRILLEPAKNADTLVIVAGYASPSMVRGHFDALPAHIKVELVVGMTSEEGLPKPFHAAFMSLQATDLNGRFTCRYVSTKPAVHSKAYVWLKNGVPTAAFVGSANYSAEAFLRRREIIVPADADSAIKYCRALQGDSIDCLAPDIEKYIQLTEFQRRKLSKKAFGPGRKKVAVARPSPGTDSVMVSLLTGKGEVGDRSGLNWGQRPGRKGNEAYIPIGSKLGKSGFFPPLAEHFTIVTDDGEYIDAVVAQAGNKAIHSYKDNSILGRFFRRRLGLKANARITLADLKRYGRTDVEFQHVGEDTFLLDFSKP